MPVAVLPNLAGVLALAARADLDGADRAIVGVAVGGATRVPLDRRDARALKPEGEADPLQQGMQSVAGARWPARLSDQRLTVPVFPQPETVMLVPGAGSVAPRSGSRTGRTDEEKLTAVASRTRPTSYLSLKYLGCECSERA